MAFVDWHADLPTPEMPLTGENVLPIVISETDGIGKLESFRHHTRGMLKGSSSILIEPIQLNTVFLPYYRVTLNDGIKYFKASWIDLLGVKGYIGRIVNARASLIGVKPKIMLDLEFYPFVQYSISDPTVPSPWPSKENA